MRKNNHVHYALSILLTAALLFSMAGCSSREETQSASAKIEYMDKEKVNSFSFDFIGGSDVMPIVGFYGPLYTSYSYNGNLFPDYFSDEIFKLIDDTGVNIISYNATSYSTYPEYVKRLLEQGEKYGIGVFVNDPRIQGEGGKEISIELMDQYINEYCNYPAYVGNYVKDEPSHIEYNGGREGSNVEDFVPIFQNLNRLGFCGYGNIFPSEGATKDGYLNYARSVIETWEMPFISYDFYPFVNKNGGLEKAETYFDNLSLIRQVAEEEGIPFWTFIQAGAQWNDDNKRFETDGYFPSQGEFYWSVGTSLAFGAKGIQYFPLIQPTYFAYAETEPHDFQRNGLIGAFGNKTRWYYYAQKMSAQIAAVDEVLMNSVNKGVIVTSDDAKYHIKGAQKYLIEGTSWRELSGVDGDAMIGCFNYEGKTALYVVNYNTEFAQKITLNFSDTYNVVVVQDAMESHLSRNNLELALSAGNSALVVFEQGGK